MRRSSASTSLTVSARSSGVDMAYGTLATWPHRSTAMMSAPSVASRIACDRPWPRAAPVMKATLPATRPVIFLPPRWGLPDCVARVDGELQAGDVARLVGGQEQHRVADVARVHGLDRQRVHVDRAEVGIAVDQRLKPAEAVAHRRVHPGRVHGVDPDLVAGQLVGHHP